MMNGAKIILWSSLGRHTDFAVLLCAGRYTDQAMRDVWKGRQVLQQPWGEVGSYADTSEAAIRSVVLAARWVKPLEGLGQQGSGLRQVLDSLVEGRQDCHVMG